MVKNIIQFGRDSTITPHESDWKQLYKEVMDAYIHQPLLARKLTLKGCGKYIPLTFDGRRIWETTLKNDVDEPGYDFTPGSKDTNFNGTLVNAMLPQIYESCTLSLDDLNMLFAGQARLPLIMEGVIAKIAEKEDKIFFRGDSTKGVNGLVSADAHDLGAVTGAWGVDTGSNGILNNMKADIKKALDYFTVNGLGDKPVDMCVTSYIWGLLDSTIKVYGDGTAKDYFTKMLRGGEIMVSDNIQASVTTTANTAVWIVRDPRAYALLSSEIQQEQDKKGLWEWQYGAREKFSVKVLNNKFVCWMDGISNATS